MCFGGGDDDALDYQKKRDREARAEEEARKARIKEGQGKIEAAFGQFNPEYFQNYRDTITGYYFPQLEEQYGKAQGTTKANLVRQGIFDATAGGNKLADLFKAYSRQRTGIADNAQSEAAKLRQNVEAQKSDLYGLNQATADPALSQTLAASRSQSLNSPPTYSPLQDVFAGLVNTGASFVQGDQQRLRPRLSFLPGSSASGSSGQVVY